MHDAQIKWCMNLYLEPAGPFRSLGSSKTRLWGHIVGWAKLDNTCRQIDVSNTMLWDGASQFYLSWRCNAASSLRPGWPRNQEDELVRPNGDLGGQYFTVVTSRAMWNYISLTVALRCRPCRMKCSSKRNTTVEYLFFYTNWFADPATA